MLLLNASGKLEKFNRYCLHYNLVAQAAYEQLKNGVGPFSTGYRPFIITALISFDMGRMMGAGVGQKYEPEQGGFASKLDLKMKAIQSDIEPLCTMSIANAEIEGVSQVIKKVTLLSQKKVSTVCTVGGKNSTSGPRKYFISLIHTFS